jgi:acetyl-CoA C-acetyltransferase
VIVGVGQVLRREVSDDQSDEPVSLMADALRLAGEDSGTGKRLLRRADSVRCVPAIGWQYRDPTALLSRLVGAQPRDTLQSALVGGEGAQRLLNHTAGAIAAGELDVALLAGSEAIASLRAAQRAGRAPAWRREDEAMQAAPTLEHARPGVNEMEAAAGLAPPVFTYALIESAVRAASGSPAEAHLARIAALWSRFSEVAAANPYAWLPHAYTPGEIATPSLDNRLVSVPYTKLLTANIGVNMASGLILASAEAAERAGVPRDRWVFVHAGAQAHDEWHVSERRELDRSPAIRAAGRAALEHAGVSIDEVAHVDLYSCFPSAVEIAAAELGLALDDPARALTVTGGLTFAGGPGNNYAGHSIATLVQLLREDPDSYGLASALGWYVTKHAIGVYGARPPRQPFAGLDIRPQLPPPRRAHAGYVGSASVEAWTVTFHRDGDPDAAIVSALTPDGGRALVRTSEADAVDALLAQDPIGARVEIAAEQRLTIEQPA